MPAQVGTEAEGTTTYSISYRREGILAFLHTNGRWSEHFVVEQFDDATEYQKRRYPFLSRLTLEDGTPLYACMSFGVDGNANYHHEAIHYTFSGAGKYWSQHELVVLDGQEYSGVLLTNGKYTYLCAATETHRSYTTELTGTPAAEIQEDITDRVLNWQADHASGRSSSFELADADEWYGESMLADGGLFSIKTEFGSYLDNTAFYYDFGLDFVDTWALSEETPQRTLGIKTRDNIARMNSEVHSSQAILTDNQTIGADKFADHTGTGYGGMAHTAPMTGSWKTVSDWLILQSNNKRGDAKTTFNLAVWNGTIQSAFRITESGAAQFAGLIFRAYNKSNFYSVEAKYTPDTLVLFEVRRGKKTQLASISRTWNVGHHLLSAGYVPLQPCHRGNLDGWRRLDGAHQHHSARSGPARESGLSHGRRHQCGSGGGRGRVHRQGLRAR